MGLFLCLCACTKPKEEDTAYDIAGKTYYNTVDDYGHEDHSKVWFGKDGSFVFNDSYSEGYEELNGKWELKENVITLNTDNNSKILFEIQDEDTLKLRTSLKGSRSDDTFSIHETKGSDVKTETDTKPDDGGGTETPSVPETVPCTGITSLYHNYWSYSGTKNWDLEIRPVPSNTTDKITFRSNDESVVTIDSQGRASAVGVGKTTIEATCGDQKLVVNYEVRDKNAEAPEGAGKKSSWKANFSDIMDVVQPSVTFDSGFFTFTENVYAGMGQYKGIYDIKNGKYVCTVDDATTMQGFAGDDVKQIVFTIVDNKTLRLETDLCMSRIGTLFYKTSE